MPHKSTHLLHLFGEPTASSVNALISSLRSDHETRSVSPKNHAHRSRVIRQQEELLRLTVGADDRLATAP